MSMLLFGDEWAERALILVQARHKAQNVQRVPSAHQGDAGLDCFTVDGSGCVYQFYGPKEPLRMEDRTQKIATKINTDTNKFIKYRDKIIPLLSGHTVDRWCLVVPKWDDKALLENCANAAAKIQAAELPYAADTIKVMIFDQDDFTAEIEALRRRSALRPSLPPVALAENSILDWQKEQPALATTMRAKLIRAYPAATDQEIANKLGLYIQNLLEGQNLLQRIREELPHEAEELIKYVQSREQALASLGSAGSCPAETLHIELADMRAQAERIASISSHDAQRYALGLVADWVARCPLDW